MKINEIKNYIIDLDELHLTGGGRHLIFKELKQFLLEATLTGQPVFRTGNILYFFVDADVAIFQKYNETLHKEYLDTWEKEMIKTRKKEYEQTKKLYGK